MDDAIILHHYDNSPFSEKVRLLLGLRGLAWRSVIQPVIMPKPDLIALTGGYRRIPVMQIGADIYCDTQVIMAEIERRTESVGAAHGPAWMLNFWADRLFFQTSVAVVFGEMGDSVPKAFIDDRQALMDRTFDVAAMKAASAPMREQWRAQAGWIETALSTGAPFLLGDTPSVGDLAAYMNIWFVSSFTPHLAGPLMDDMPRLVGWRERMKAIGHGRRSEMTPANALNVARNSRPSEGIANDPSDPLGLAPGSMVAVSADDYGRDPIVGRLVAANRQRLAIERDAGSVGRLHVHFPRAGYWVTPQ